MLYVIFQLFACGPAKRQDHRAVPDQKDGTVWLASCLCSLCVLFVFLILLFVSRTVIVH